MEPLSYSGSLPADIVGYLIGLCPIIVAVRLRCCCKALSKTFVWNNILHFDNSHYTADEGERVLEALFANVDHIKRFESLVIHAIPTKQSQSALNQFVSRIAHQLRRIERLPDTTYLAEEQELLQKLDPRILQDMYLPAFTLTNVMEFFQSHTSFDALRKLALTQDEPDHMYDHITRGIDSARPLLRIVAARTSKLESLFVCLTNLNDATGPMIDDVKRLVEANQETLKVFDFSANSDTSSFRTVLSTNPTLAWLNTVFHGAVTDASKWNTIPNAVREHFGIDIAKFRIRGYTLWQSAMFNYVSNNGTFPPLEATQALYNAVYPKERTWCGARMGAFEVFLRPPVIQSLNIKPTEDSKKLHRDYETWMLSEAKANLDNFDPRSERLSPLLFGLISIIYFQKSIQSSFEELWERMREIATIAAPHAPLVAIFEAIEEQDIFLCTEELKDLALMLIQDNRGMKIFLFAPIGVARWPLGILLRQYAPKSFYKLMENPELFDPLALEPSRRIPSIVFHICFPPFKRIHQPSGFQNLSPLFKMFEQVESQLGEFRYGPIEDLHHLVRFSQEGPGFDIIVTKLLHPLDFTDTDLVEQIVAKNVNNWDTLVPIIIARIQQHEDGAKLLETFSALCWRHLKQRQTRSLALALSKFLEMPQDLKTHLDIS